ncbi:bifunctional [glutamate--ammonia ligase]-adenylyl-L-tyrosine phosphorylase/[glutamate--ammonia-ligase] adenylyltransferase [Oleiagrimonas sp. C23AA]|uniref:bifunctional [glutamate--ammonia ligase]-adenylyl-L-tyrosine phosphorylase/[glutamate--ammonia-ligase] adenylyltransferase n=1 Tax=Oleiagrimonas sp. C23AA TaxID=2719047 RepID=UPI001420524A|nr:bifunctional [glutamate--ammonia ligase]-adenylyl-L-tyrosine phosphorylase/[glutamate--ammonia-ligase] adenylyltransferase [Oleiagrimonas sp. C23AA]NII12300.1 bifunctional [glutamate--ammonia ligase]-adenylyl-L-tyrosine phosphorylase/[glutamate--ammonia-ligase] adenylyltransferase [Oleiagrimonas sp. C23AA]
MNEDCSLLPPDLRELIDERTTALHACCDQVDVPWPSGLGLARLRRVLLASDFVFDALRRQPAAAIALLEVTGGADLRRDALALPDDEAGALRALRQFRHREAARLVYRDVNGLDQLSTTLAETSVLYEVLLQAALAWAEAQLQRRYGVPRDGEGQAQRLVVLGFGKLGGNELNFSSDIDLVLAYREPGQTDGTRALDNSEFFVRLGRQLVRLMAEPGADGIAARMDLRLRPFGQAGRLALPFGAMEQYYQREGRDWERYAWIKARPVAGDLQAGDELLDMLRPFVYRKYLDFTAFAGLREMKALIDAEVARKDLADNLKTGPGGIREIEFIVQLAQLIRGGREPALRVRGLLPALAECEARGHIPKARTAHLREAYVFLRRLENRVQMLRDAQTHSIPDDATLRERVARALDYADWAALERELAEHRQTVTDAFAATLLPHAGGHAEPMAHDVALWHAAEAGSLDEAAMEAAGFVPGSAALSALQQVPQAASVRAMSARGRERLQRLMPQLLAAARQTREPALGLSRLCKLVQSVARRSAYLALLEEQPAARRRVAELFARHAFLAERVIEQPLLLDDVLDPRIDQLPLRRADLAKEISHALDSLDERDAEQELERINELKASLAFRLGLAFRDGRADAEATARRLAALASAVLGALITLAERELAAQHGHLPGEGSGFAVLGYGSLGGEELGFASDLDLVFVFDGARATAMSDGRRAIDGIRYYQRMAQRVMHWLSVLTRGGRLYEVDTRLRPDGSKGLLVTSLDAFEAYQRGRAWTWEHQALLRARPVAGDPVLGARLATVRETVLRQPREADHIRVEVAAMRRRWRHERDRSDPAQVDLKQGHGALLDIEFLLQGLVLAHASEQPSLLAATSTLGLIRVCAKHGLLSGEQADDLRQAHRVLLECALACTLDMRPRVIARDASVARACAAVQSVCEALGYAFVPEPGGG